MTFVTCTQFKDSQAAQDEKLNKLEECCQKGTEKNAEQDKAISTLQNGALSADDALVDKTGVSDGQGKGAGKITVAKVKEAIEGDLAVAVDAKKGLSGNGKNSEPLAVNAKKGDFTFNAQTGALELGGNALQAGNIGNGLKYDPNTGKYDVNIGSGLEVNGDGAVVLKPTVPAAPQTEQLSNAIGSVIGEKYTIDYGNGLIETNGLITFPLRTEPNSDTQSRYEVDGFITGCGQTPTRYNGNDLYHKESWLPISAESLGMSKILSINAIACDLSGYRTETPWVVNETLFSSSFNLGVHTLASLDQGSIKVMFQVKGLKA